MWFAVIANWSCGCLPTGLNSRSIARNVTVFCWRSIRFAFRHGRELARQSGALGSARLMQWLRGVLA